MKIVAYAGAGLALCLFSGLGSAADTGSIPGYIKAAVAEPTRPERDRQRDADRKPEQVIAFAGIKPGDKVGELMPGNGYFTRIFCRIVGDKGQVDTVRITQAIKIDRPPPPPDANVQPNPCTNVNDVSQAAADFSLPSGLDLVWTSENYHDLHNAMYGAPDMKAFDTVIFKALKPGGVLIVEDHAAETGSGTRDTDTLHRIDPEQVKKELTAVGFVLAGSSDLLRNPADTHTVKVFEMRGKTDKLLLKFRKPK